MARFLEDGRPQAGRAVAVVCDSERLPHLATTDAAGSCTLVDLPAAQELRVLLDGTTLQRGLVLAPDETRERTWELAPCRVTGIVRDQDGRTLPGLWLCVFRNSERAQSFFIRVASGSFPHLERTDAEGRYAVTLESGTWWIGPEPADPHNPNSQASPYTTRINVPEGALHLTADLSVHCGLFARGVVVDREGHPLAHALVQGRKVDSPGSIEPSLSDADGRFTMGPLVPGEYALQAQAIGFARGPEQHVDAGATAIELVLGAPDGE